MSVHGGTFISFSFNTLRARGDKDISGLNVIPLDKLLLPPFDERHLKKTGKIKITTSVIVTSQCYTYSCTLLRYFTADLAIKIYVQTDVTLTVQRS